MQHIEYPFPGPRIETGAVQFGDDYPGYFIRADNAYGLALEINQLKAYLEAWKNGTVGRLHWMLGEKAMESLVKLAESIRADVCEFPEEETT